MRVHGIRSWFTRLLLPKQVWSGMVGKGLKGWGAEASSCALEQLLHVSLPIMLICNHLKTFMVFVAKVSRNSYSSVTVYSVRTCHLRARRA